MYHLAPRVANNPANLPYYLEYVDTVNTMLEVHIETDNRFFKLLAGKSKGFRVPAANGLTALEKDLRSLHATIANIKAGKQYEPTVIRTALEGMKGNILEVIHKQVSYEPLQTSFSLTRYDDHQSIFFDAPAIPNDVSEEQLAELVNGALITIDPPAEAIINHLACRCLALASHSL